MKTFEQKLASKTYESNVYRARSLKIALEAICIRYDNFHRTINRTIFRSNVNEGYAHATVLKLKFFSGCLELVRQ